MPNFRSVGTFNKEYTEEEQNLPPPLQPGFSQGRLHMGGICPPYGGRTSAGGQSVNGGTHEGGIDLMRGPNFDRLHHKLKVLLLLSCNYTVQFIGYDSIKTC